MRTTLRSYPFGEAFHHGQVALAQNRVRLDLQVGEGLFSGAAVDVGTRLLLRTLAGLGRDRKRAILDLGCGYGPLGLALRSLFSDSTVEMVDRDALAVAYAALNAEMNELSAGTAIYEGLGWADIPTERHFDLVVSNIPAKAGPAAITSWLLDGRRHADAETLFAVVVINRLIDQVDEVLTAAEAEVLLKQANRGHVVVHYRLHMDGGIPSQPGLHLHHRGRRRFTVGKIGWHAETAWGLPEFDSLHHATRLAVRALRELHRRPDMNTAVVNVGVGHGALALDDVIRPAHIHLVDRDLLALRMADANLESAGVDEERRTLHHTPLMETDPESLDIGLVVFTAPVAQKVADASVDAVSRSLRPAGRLVLSGTSTTVTRSLETIKRNRLPLVALSRSRDKSHSVVDLVRRPDS